MPGWEPILFYQLTLISSAGASIRVLSKTWAPRCR